MDANTTTPDAVLQQSESDQADDPIFQEEQAHLNELYKKLLGYRDELTHQDRKSVV